MQSSRVDFASCVLALLILSYISGASSMDEFLIKCFSYNIF